MRREDIWVDFGLSGLTKWFTVPWGEATEDEIVAEVAGWGDGSYAPTLLEDALRLRNSSMPTQTIDLLMRAAIGLPYEPDDVRRDGRTRLDAMIRICTERIRCDDPSFEPAPPEPAVGSPLLREAVLAEIRAVAPAVRDEVGARGSEVQAALEQVVAEIDPDLGFRLFLRVMKAYPVAITETRYLRYHELGECFGYNEFVVDDGTLHSVPDPD